MDGGYMIKNENEKLLYELLNEAYPGQWVSEHKGIEGRKFRFDCANPEKKIAIEINGGLWTYGRHSRPIGMQQDYIKYNAATVEGWRVLIYTPEMLRNQPGLIISAVRQLCGYDDSQQTLCLDGCTQGTLSQVQVKIS